MAPNMEIKHNDINKNEIDISVKCPFCGTVSEITVSKDSFMTWQMGEMIQMAMPELGADEREILVSGLCLKCQAEVFGE